MSTLKQHVMGIDFGSTTAKTVILDLAGNIVASNIQSMGAVSNDGVRASIAAALAQAGLRQTDMGLTVSTGYGRRMLDEADRNYTEITCHARGALTMEPTARTIIDIGGQDSKVIALDDNGVVLRFAMNDRCAAGTGKFLEVLARAMDIPLEAMGALAMQAEDSLKISSMCATFAESEVISLLAEGQSKANILGGVHSAIATRTKGLAARVNGEQPIVMTGGVANNVAAVHYLEQAFGGRFILPATPQIAGALGAAVLALEEYLDTHSNHFSEADDERTQQRLLPDAPFSPPCKSAQPATPAAQLIQTEASAENSRSN